MARIDLRSDTVTHPTDAMRRAMATAELGDDVFGDDPTVNALEERAAALLGKEAGLFVASGTMGNLVCLLAHLPRGHEAIAGASTHTVMDEAGGHAVVASTTIRALAERADGTMDPAEIADAFRDPTDYHEPQTGLVVLENTHAHSGGRPLTLEYTTDGRGHRARARRAPPRRRRPVLQRMRGAGPRPRRSWRRPPTASPSASPRASRRLSARSWSVPPRSSTARAAPGSSSAAGCARWACWPRRAWSPCRTATRG